MATRPDPSLPVVINISSLGVNYPENYTRVFTIASFGDTTLGANEIVSITKATITDAKIKGDSYTHKLVNSYFANNSQGSVNIIELKETITEEHIHTYLAGDYYVDKTAGNVVKKALQEDKATSATDYKPLKFGEEAFWQETAEVKKYNIGDYYIDFENKKEYIALREDDATSLTDLKPTKITNGNFWKEDANEVSIERAITMLNDFVLNGTVKSYEIACPPEFYTIQSFIDLVKLYSDLTSDTYFSIEMPEGINPEIDTTFKLYNKSKSFVPIIPSQISTESANGILGIKASSKYDLSSSNPLSPLQWKKVNGITALSKVKANILKAYNDNGCNWIGDFNKNIVVFGGMVGDGKNWEFYFALDTFKFELQKQLGVMMIQSANNPLQSIHFNQNGINVIAKKLEAISNQMVSWGVLEEFGSAYDFETNSIQNVGSWNITDYATYKANSYEKWAKGIYDGAFVYATIGNFILQIAINMTIE